MSEKDIQRWADTVTPRDKASHPWTLGSGGSFDMQEVQPIPDEMLAELAQRYHYAGTPWNCRSMPLSPSDREYMYLLYYAMQGLVARMLRAEKAAASASAWRPLSEAPKDGDEVLVWPHPSDSEMTGYYWPYPDHKERKQGRWYSARDRIRGCSFEIHPTHWMPLPEPPT